MSARNLILVRGLIGLLVVWGLVFATVRVAGWKKPTLERLAAYQENNPLSEIDDVERRREVIARTAEMLNGMEAGEVARLNDPEGADPRRDFFREMTSDEQLFFLEKRVGRAFQQMMQSFNEMERAERKRIVDRALRRMEENGGLGPGGRGPDRGRLEEADPEIAEKIAEAGLRAYYADASAETKIDLAPLLEAMQGAMSEMGGRPR